MRPFNTTGGTPATRPFKTNDGMHCTHPCGPRPMGTAPTTPSDVFAKRTCQTAMHTGARSVSARQCGYALFRGADEAVVPERDGAADAVGP